LYKIHNFSRQGAALQAFCAAGEKFILEGKSESAASMKRKVVGMTLYTIGAGKKSAREFFPLLQNSGVRRLIDVRLNNTSQLAGFTKKPDLEYFLQAIAGIDYVHMPEFAPTEDLMDGFKGKKIGWPEYEAGYARLLADRQALSKHNPGFFADACLLCSEPAAKQCHRRLLAEQLAARIPGLKVVHL